MDVHMVKELLGGKDTHPVSYSKEDVINYGLMTENKNILDYLMHCLTANGVTCSEIYLENIQGIKEAILDYTPACYLFPYGFLSIGGTIGGNVVCVDTLDPKSTIYYADHELFSESEVTVVNKETRNIECLPELNRENILRGLFCFEMSLEKFIIKALNGELVDIIRELELGD